jgi:hypothetical protein
MSDNEINRKTAIWLKNHNRPIDCEDCGNLLSWTVKKVHRATAATLGVRGRRVTARDVPDPRVVEFVCGSCSGSRLVGEEKLTL